MAEFSNEGKDELCDLPERSLTSQTPYQASRASLRNISELLAKDSEDESLRRYKENLLGAAVHGDTGDRSDPRRLIVTEFAVVFEPSEGRPDIVNNLDTEEGLERLKVQGIQMKEGAKFKFRISFRVQHEIIAGIKFQNRVSKMMFSAEEALMIGSYPPSSVPHTFEFPRFDYSEAPKGMLHRGRYTVKNSFHDSDGVKYLEFDYGLDINKSW